MDPHPHTEVLLLVGTPSPTEHKPPLTIYKSVGVCNFMKMVRFLIMLMLILLSSRVQGGGREQWKEKDLKQFGEGENQSPISIQYDDVQTNPDLGNLGPEYYPAPAILKNLGHEVKVAWLEDAGSVEIQGVKYTLKQCHWHHPSEHTLNGKNYPLELHMVHQMDDAIIVIAIIYKIGAPDAFLTRLHYYIQQLSWLPEIEVDSVDANIIGIGSDTAYFRYYGSLTTPPYTEPVQWTVISQVRTASQEQVDSLRAAINSADNSREVQPLNGRIVEFFAPNGLAAINSSQT